MVGILNNVFVILDVVFCILDGVLGIWAGVFVIWYIVLGIFDDVQAGVSEECIAMAFTPNISICRTQSQSTIEGPKLVMWTPPW